MNEILVEKGNKTIRWKTLTANDFNEVKRLLLEVYYAGDPYYDMMDATLHDFSEHKLPKVTELFQKDIISIGAYDDADESRLCGMALLSISETLSEKENCISPITDEGKKEDSLDMITERFDVAMLEGIVDNSDNQPCMVIGVTTVEEKYRKMGIATELYKKVEMLARKRHCKSIVLCCSSTFTQKIGENLGYKLLREIKYAEYFDPVLGTKPVPITMDMHPSTTTFILYLN